MKQAINITHEECENVRRLFYKYNAYMSMLEYLATNASNTDIFDKKWNEAADIWIELDLAKSAIEPKYKPEGEWDRYEFDFDNTQVVFYKE